jgi:hypothetical protein
LFHPSFWHTLSFTWGPYAAFYGMARKCHNEDSMITTIWTHLQMFLISISTIFTFKCWMLFKQLLCMWTIACTYHFCPRTGSTKPGLQYCQLYRVWRSLVIPFSLFYNVSCYPMQLFVVFCHICGFRWYKVSPTIMLKKNHLSSYRSFIHCCI